ncbi:MAG TPA: hypothetical protein VFZ99_08095 [Terriglobales bacterium]
MPKSLLRILLGAVACLALLPPASFAQGNGHGRNKHQDQDMRDDDDRDYDRDSHRDHDRNHDRDRDRDHDGDRDHDRDHRSHHAVAIIFSTHDRDIIRDYYSDRFSNLPPGLAKRNGDLPPGLQKHLERGGSLPPGLQKRLTPFPEELDARLPRLPSIYRRATIGVDVVILDRRTARIVDIMHDILRP